MHGFALTAGVNDGAAPRATGGDGGGVSAAEPAAPANGDRGRATMGEKGPSSASRQKEVWIVVCVCVHECACVCVCLSVCVCV